MLVVPTCRPESLKSFLSAWEVNCGWDQICVVEDAHVASDEIEKALPDTALHFSHIGIKELLKDDAWIISKRDSAIRCFGFLIAYRDGMDVLTLDDDCLPLSSSCSETFVTQHQQAMIHPRWVEAVPGMRTRGLPYRNLGTMQSMVNVGLWAGVPDLDGPQGLLHPQDNFVPPSGSRLIPTGQYTPMCGMNLYIRHEALPLMYFPLMGEGQPYRRFDDIWCGIIAKKCMDHLGWKMSVGEPFVHHQRASDPIANMVKEAPGIEANEKFWEIVDSAPIPSGVVDPLAAMTLIGEYLADEVGDPYLEKLGKAIGVWVRLLEKTK